MTHPTPYPQRPGKAFEKSHHLDRTRHGVWRLKFTLPGTDKTISRKRWTFSLRTKVRKEAESRAFLIKEFIHGFVPELVRAGLKMEIERCDN